MSISGPPPNHSYDTEQSTRDDMDLTIAMLDSLLLFDEEDYRSPPSPRVSNVGQSSSLSIYSEQAPVPSRFSSTHVPGDHAMQQGNMQLQHTLSTTPQLSQQQQPPQPQQQQPPSPVPSSTAEGVMLLARPTFFQMLSTWFQSHRISPEVPRFAGRALDLHMLFGEVLVRGGHEKVSQNEMWDAVGGKIGWGEDTMNDGGLKSSPQIAEMLKMTYQRMLGEFEGVYIQAQRSQKIQQLLQQQQGAYYAQRQQQQSIQQRNLNFSISPPPQQPQRQQQHQLQQNQPQSQLQNPNATSQPHQNQQWTNQNQGQPSQPQQQQRQASSSPSVPSTTAEGVMLLARPTFFHLLSAWCRSRRITPEVPRFAGRAIDLHMLFGEVLVRGGHEKVTQSEMWDIVGGKIGWGENTMNDGGLKSSPQIAEMLKMTYQRMLGEFEGFYIQAQRAQQQRQMMQQKQPQAQLPNPNAPSQSQPLQQMGPRWSPKRERIQEAHNLVTSIRQTAAQNRSLESKGQVADKDRITFYAELAMLVPLTTALDQHLDMYYALAENITAQTLLRIIQIAYAFKEQKDMLDQAPNHVASSYLFGLEDLRNDARFVGTHSTNLKMVQVKFQQYIQSMPSRQMQQPAHP